MGLVRTDAASALPSYSADGDLRPAGTNCGVDTALRRRWTVGAAVEQRLGSGRLACPGCSAVLAERRRRCGGFDRSRLTRRCAAARASPASSSSPVTGEGRQLPRGHLAVTTRNENIEEMAAEHGCVRAASRCSTGPCGQERNRPEGSRPFDWITRNVRRSTHAAGGRRDPAGPPSAAAHRAGDRRPDHPAAQRRRTAMISTDTASAATHSRHHRAGPPAEPKPRPPRRVQPRALSAGERAEVGELLNSELSGSSTLYRPRSGPRCSTRAATCAASRACTGSCASTARSANAAAKPSTRRRRSPSCSRQCRTSAGRGTSSCAGRRSGPTPSTLMDLQAGRDAARRPVRYKSHPRPDGLLQHSGDDCAMVRLVLAAYPAVLPSLFAVRRLRSSRVKNASICATSHSTGRSAPSWGSTSKDLCPFVHASARSAQQDHSRPRRAGQCQQCAEVGVR